MKFPAIGRKNYLFVGSPRGGHGAAVMYSLVSSAKANGVEPFAWLRDLFTRLPYHRDGQAFAQSAAGEAVTAAELDDLLPDRWLKSHPDCVWTIDVIRRSERRRKTGHLDAAVEVSSRATRHVINFATSWVLEFRTDVQG